MTTLDGSKNWNQPICLKCWDTRHPQVQPTAIADVTTETCSNCGEPTTDGVYIRRDPATVNYPKLPDATEEEVQQ